MKYSLLLYDHNHFYIEALQENLVEKTMFQRIVCTTQRHEFFTLIAKSHFDFLLVGKDAIDANKLCEFIKQQQPTFRQTKIVYLGETREIQTIRKLFEHGVVAYFDCDVSLDEFLNGMQSVVAGNIYICNSAKERMLNYISFQDRFIKNTSESLTKRELEVMKLICDGLSSKCISEKLFISLNTVETHRKKILLKLNVKNSVGIFKYAVENKILE